MTNNYWSTLLVLEVAKMAMWWKKTGAELEIKETGFEFQDLHFGPL